MSKPSRWYSISGIALGHRPQADALLEVVHLVEVLAPLAVHDLQQHLPLQLAHPALHGEELVDLGFALGVRVAGVREHGGEELVAREVDGRVTVLARDLLLHADRVQGAQRGPELVQVPVLGVALRGGALDVGRAPRPRACAGSAPDVLAGQHPAALVVDDGALLVETSSYFRTFLRISKFCCSTWVCALRMPW
jgi:hypothetical protein